MIRQPRLLRPQHLTRGHGQGRLARVMRAHVTADVDVLRHQMVGDDLRWELTTLDAATSLDIPAVASTTIVHVLWTASDQGTEIIADQRATPGESPASCVMHPGDSLVIPARTGWSLSGGSILQLMRTGRVGTARGDGPSHGLSVFDRFNRRTVCAVTGDLALDRWKLTGPQRVGWASGTWHLFCNLVTPTSLIWAGGIIQLDRLAVCAVPPGIEQVTLVPNDLGYVTHTYAPDIARNVLIPFRQAGFDRAAMTRVPGLAELL